MHVDIAVITINYNSSDATLKCVQELLAKTDPCLRIEIVVVDNNSVASDFAKLDCLVSDSRVTIIRNRINAGFAAGNMLGVISVSADYYFFINNDCIIQNDCMSLLKNFADQTPRGGIFSPQLVDESGHVVVSFDYYPELLSKILGRMVFRWKKGDQYYSRRVFHQSPIQIDVPSGSQLFVRASAFHEVGGFDTNFFLYCEEEDLALRMRQHDYLCYLVPAAHNLHIGGVSTVRSLDIEKEFLISFFYLYRKHYGILKTLALRLLMLSRHTKKLLTGRSSLSILLFILKGPSLADSMRHKQTISNT